MITLLSYDDVTFAGIEWTPIIPASAREEWNVESRITPRTGNSSILGVGSISPRRVTVDFIYDGTGDIREAVDELVGLLDPRNPNPRLLIGTRAGGETVQRAATVEIPSASDANESLNGLRVVFVSEEVEWTETTATTATQSGSITPFALTHANAGQATVFPRYRVAWTAQHSAKGAVVGQQYRKRMTLTNTQARTIGPFPWRIDLGNTATLVTGSKLQADGDDLRVILDGQDMTRKLVGINLEQTFAWVVIPGMDAAEVLTLDIIYGNASATTPPTWTDPDPDKPVFDTDFETGTATGGSTTTVVKASATCETNRWYYGYVHMLSGLNAGASRSISTNTGTTITVTSAFSNAVVNTDRFLLVMGSNERWVYGVRQTERNSDWARGRFYVNNRGNRPSVTDYDAPGSWRPELVTDNRDSFGQARYSFLDNGTDSDTYAVLDAARMWEGNDKRVPQAGTADGLALTTPTPITQLDWEYQLDNPNGMVKAYVGVRASGAEDWAEAFSDTAATSGFTSRSSGVNPLAITATFGDVWQMVHALLPYDDVEIDLDWKITESSATSGTTTTTTDSLQEWATNQFSNGSIRMRSGANAGRKRLISSNSSTVITHAAFPVANADGDRYILRNKRLKGRLRDGGRLAVSLTPTAITDSGLGSETAVYDVAATLWVGEGPNGEADGQHRALLGYATNGTVDAGDERRIFLAATEQLEIDAGLRRIRIYDTGSAGYVGELTDPAVIVQWHNGTAWKRSGNWLPWAPDRNALTNPTALTDATGWTHSFTHASATAAFARDASVFHDAAGSFKFTISANTAGGPNVEIAKAQTTATVGSVSPGDGIAFAGWVRTTHANLDPVLVIDWYTVGDAYISSSVSGDIGLAANTWSSLSAAGIAPATAAAYRVALVVYSDANQTGTVYYDELSANGGEGVAWLSETNIGTLSLDLSYYASWLGA